MVFICAKLVTVNKESTLLTSHFVPLRASTAKQTLSLKSNYNQISSMTMLHTTGAFMYLNQVTYLPLLSHLPGPHLHRKTHYVAFQIP
jgi:hypothetical protein